MHLREYVRDDDVDLAISVMLESFIQSQKHAVARMIQRKFIHYMTFREENTILLLNLLEKMVREKIQFMNIVKSIDDNMEIKIHKEDFESAAKELSIHDLT